jgi:hypothetical protein
MFPRLGQHCVERGGQRADLVARPAVFDSPAEVTLRADGLGGGGDVVDRAQRGAGQQPADPEGQPGHAQAADDLAARERGEQLVELGQRAGDLGDRDETAVVMAAGCGNRPPARLVVSITRSPAAGLQRAR